MTLSAPAVDLIIVPCEACGTEGRIYYRGYGYDPRTGEETGGWSEPCPYCDGTGGEIIEAEPVTEEDIMLPAMEAA